MQPSMDIVEESQLDAQWKMMRWLLLINLILASQGSELWLLISSNMSVHGWTTDNSRFVENIKPQELSLKYRNGTLFGLRRDRSIESQCTAKFGYISLNHYVDMDRRL